ncbi:MAG: MBL fold metallo-hydrolase [Rhodospirillaceae bacterium]|nr:MBL fold metallo-hydrolase [Rhodospirillaceae bacterium]
MKRTIGDVTVQRIEETVQLSFKPEVLFPNFDPDSLRRHAHWLAPAHFDPDEGRFRTSVHSFLVRTGRHNILIDTCGGNHKHRPYLLRFHQREWPWLDRLAAAGVASEQIDYVMCTHLHLDHVGWNTRLVDGRWVPTFPNAKYLFHRIELDRWNPAHPSFTPAALNQFIWEDSVAPVVAAGQAVAIDDGYELDGMLRVEAAPGHTLGHVRIALASRNGRAMFSGDLMHVPLQVYYPDWYTCLDDDPQRGIASRRKLLEDCADRHALLLPTHFVAPHCCRITRDGDGFGIEWNVA